MPSLTSTLLAKPWLIASSVALLGAAGATTGLIVTHHHHSSGVKVRVLGENFQNSGGAQSGGAGTAPQPGKPVTPSNPTAAGRSSGTLTFTISANVSGITPGTPTTLPVQITNPTSTGGTLTINTINVVPHDVANGVCDASNLAVTNYDSAQPGAAVYALAKGTSTTIDLPIWFRDLLKVNQTPCLGQSFSLSISGTGTVTHP